jgi:hypothetical protein
MQNPAIEVIYVELYRICGKSLHQESKNGESDYRYLIQLKLPKENTGAPEVLQ